MYLQRIVATILFVLGTLMFAGQTGKIAGKVTDSQNGGALVGCNVSVVGTPYGAVADANGEYFIINLSPGKYDVEFSMIGYAGYTAEDVVSILTLLRRWMLVLQQKPCKWKVFPSLLKHQRSRIH